MNLLTLPQRVEILKRFENLLDEVLLVQKQEQDAILEREVQKLPELSQKIEQYSTQLSLMRGDMAPVRGRPVDLHPMEEKLRQTCVIKFQQMQQKANENNALLQNSLRFLAQVMTEFVGAQRRTTVYNQAGEIGDAYNQSGVMVNIHA